MGSPSGSHHDVDLNVALAGVVQPVPREYLADPTARLRDLVAEPLAELGHSGNRLQRVRLRWSGTWAGKGGTTWVVKRWLPGGLGDRLLRVDLSLEALGWETGLLRLESLPPDVYVPIVGVRRDEVGRGAWIVMEDVRDALARYGRESPLQRPEAVARVSLVLDRLARPPPVSSRMFASIGITPTAVARLIHARGGGHVRWPCLPMG